MSIYTYFWRPYTILYNKVYAFALSVKRFFSLSSNILIVKFINNLFYLLRPNRFLILSFIKELIKSGYFKSHLIINLPVIDWNFRFQRPQQLASIIARNSEYKQIVLAYKPNPFYDFNKVNDSLYILSYPFVGNFNIYNCSDLDKQFTFLQKITRSILFSLFPKSLTLIVNHPSWFNYANYLKNKFNASVIYDCMDDHQSFDNVSKRINFYEKLLIENSNAITTSSNYLYQKCFTLNEKTFLIKNGNDFDYFNSTSLKKLPIMSDFIDGKTTIGYFGAISSWFDFDLVLKISKIYPNYRFIFIGMIDKSNNNIDKYNFPKNLIFLGEVPYSKLIDYLKYIDICIIPFVINELTKATNPVKLYEYFAAGKPVVSTNLPELNDYKNYAYVSRNHKEFIENLNKAALDLNDKPINNKLIMQRKKIAKKSSWINRGRDYIKVLNLIRSETIFKTTRKINKPEKTLISIIIVSYNNCDLLKKCISSINDNTDLNYEIIIVDNDSDIDTKNFLYQWVAKNIQHTVIFNKNNLGFSKANNIGIKKSKGDFFVLLNNDTKVTKDWLGKLVNHYLSNKDIGLVGPVTNNIGNEAKIDINYKDDKEMVLKASQYMKKNKNLYFETKNLAFFCVLFSKEILHSVGYLDENYGLGFFEDDDYCKRVIQKGYRIICAEDVFVHHELSASFNKLHQYKRQKLFNKNKKYFEKKWGKWNPHNSRFF